MKILTDLHTKRRQSLCEAGCFVSPRFTGFLHEVSERLLAQDRMRLHWLELDGSPAAAEFQVVGRDVTYAYQAGVDPDRMEDEPGRIINIATLQKAIADGQRGFDFLRGDEPYKAHWRAEPQPNLSLRIVPPRITAQIRQRMWLAGKAVKRWIKNGLSITGMWM